MNKLVDKLLMLVIRFTDFNKRWKWYDEQGWQPRPQPRR